MSPARNRIGEIVFASLLVVLLVAGASRLAAPAHAQGAKDAADADMDAAESADDGAGEKPREAAGAARAKAGGKELPSSKVKQNGKMSAVKTTAQKLTASVTKPCGKCKGDGKLRVRQRDGGRPAQSDCGDCKEGRVPNDPAKVTAAAIAVATAITRMAPDAAGADVALQEAYDAITEVILRDRSRYLALQKQGTFALSAKSPTVGKVLMLKAQFVREAPHPAKSEETLYLVKIPHKKLTVAVVAPKHAELPPEGGRVLVAGAVAGTADLEGQKVAILEYGFLTSPTVDHRWWLAEW